VLGSPGPELRSLTPTVNNTGRHLKLDQSKARNIISPMVLRPEYEQSTDCIRRIVVRCRVKTWGMEVVGRPWLLARVYGFRLPRFLWGDDA
jgi:hypothetical protein